MRKRLPVLAMAIFALCSVASAYYPWTYFAGGVNPFTPVPAKFDLSALADAHTISYFISDQAPSPMMPNDSFTALVSQIRLAAEAWNGVSSSDLRLTFGGMSSAATLQSSAGVDVVFDDDMPPGLLAQSRPTVSDDLTGLAKGATFVPILRSKLQLRKDLTTYQQASFYDSFFLTIVHEFGHTLGLQHTLTSGVMSTAVTRATTKAKPLSADDVAGISLLYPAAGFAASTGSITGRVVLGGAGVNMASVVALSTTGIAVSGMSNPDGAYRIDGVPPGQYMIYVHPLPPAQAGEAWPDNIQPPQDAAHNSYAANTGFRTQFYPATQDWTQATQIVVAAGASTDGINFNVTATSGPAVYGMETYAYLGAGGQIPVPAPLLQSGSRLWLVFYAAGATTLKNNTYQVATGLSVSVIGGAARVEPATLASDGSGFLRIVLDTNAVTADTPTAMAIRLNNDVYVLPAAFTVISSAAPAISSVTPGVDAQGNPTAAVAGSNLGLVTKVLFDGAAAAVLNVNDDGSLVVSAPPAAGGYQAAVEVLTSDGQSSSQALGPVEGPVFNYNTAGTPVIITNPPNVVAGTDTVIEIDGANTNFIDGLTTVGFGSSDIFVRRVWVTAPGRILVNVSVRATAPATLTSVSVATGLQTASLTAAFQILAANPGQLTLRAPVLNLSTQLDGAPVGGMVTINVPGLPATIDGWRLFIGNQAANYWLNGPGQILAMVPNVPLGPEVVQLTTAGGAMLPPVVIQVDAPPPVITAASGAIAGDAPAAGAAAKSVKTGDTVTLAISGLADPVQGLPAAANVRISIGGVNTAAASVAADGSTVQFVVPAGIANSDQTPVTVRVGTRVSSAFTISVQNP